MNLAQRAQAEQEALALLTSAHAGQLLRTAYASYGSIRSWHIHRVHHRPGAGISVGYSVQFRNGHNSYILLSTERIDEKKLHQHGGRTLRAGSKRVHVWEYPYDPELPALEVASSSRLMEKFLGYPVDIELLSYRPTRRAVLRIEAPHELLYAKVLRPDKHKDLLRRLQLLEDSGYPAPQVLKGADGHALSRTGLILTHAVSGVSLSHFYSRMNPALMPQADELLDNIESTLDLLPKTAMLFPRHHAWVDRCTHYAHAASLALPPEDAERAHKVATHIRYLMDHADMGEMAVSHGDFYEANICIDPDSYEISAVLDVDCLGPGYRVNDWGCLLGHLAVLRSLAPHRYRYTDTLCAHWFEELSRRVDPVALCASTAGVILSLVAGARKKRHSTRRDHGQELAYTRLLLAEEWASAGLEILHDPHSYAPIISMHTSRTHS